MKQRTLFLLLGLLTVAVLVLREVGVVELSAFRSEQYSTCQTAWHADQDLKLHWVGGHGRWRDDDAGTIGVSGTGPDGQLTCTARLTRFELEGPCWVPLRKSGTASFAAELRTEDDRVIGEFDGELTRTVTGLCSLRQFRSLMRADALDYVESSIASHL